MTVPHHFKVSSFGGEPSDVQNARGNPLFKRADLEWSAPLLWEKNEPAPVGAEDRPCVYALIRNHGNGDRKINLVYIGLTRNPQNRFANHPKAKAIVALRGKVGLSLAPIDFIKGKNRITNIGRALDEIEHLLIWALSSEDLENDRKQYTLPGMGTNGSNAWHIVNKGYRFSGIMPREIVYPWMICKSGRDRSWKSD